MLVPIGAETMVVMTRAGTLAALDAIMSSAIGADREIDAEIEDHMEPQPFGADGPRHYTDDSVEARGLISRMFDGVVITEHGWPNEMFGVKLASDWGPTIEVVVEKGLEPYALLRAACQLAIWQEQKGLAR